MVVSEYKPTKEEKARSEREKKFPYNSPQKEAIDLINWDTKQKSNKGEDREFFPSLSVDASDDHEEHIRKHTLLLKSPDIELSLRAQNLLREHIDDHRNALNVGNLYGL